MIMKRLASLYIFVLMTIGCFAVENTDSFNYMPEIHGTLRTRFEMDTQHGDSRFQVRNARVFVTGKIAPILMYYFKVDLCDRGKFKFLDAYARVNVPHDLQIQAGQMLLPHGTESLRSPDSYIFSNNSFIGKYMSGTRAVGTKMMWNPGPLTLQLGAYNTSDKSDHDVWLRDFTWVTKATLTMGSHWRSEAGFMSSSPDSVRLNQIGASLNYHIDRLEVEGEYNHVHYAKNAHHQTNAWTLWAQYHWPLKNSFFDRVSAEARFDGTTAVSEGKRDADGALIVAAPAQRRITLGTTLTYIYKWMHADVRLNYEKYFFNQGYKPAVGQGDDLSLELVVRF